MLTEDNCALPQPCCKAGLRIHSPGPTTTSPLRREHSYLLGRLVQWLAADLGSQVTGTELVPGLCRGMCELEPNHKLLELPEVHTPQR